MRLTAAPREISRAHGGPGVFGQTHRPLRPTSTLKSILFRIHCAAADTPGLADLLAYLTSTLTSYLYPEHAGAPLPRPSSQT